MIKQDKITGYFYVECGDCKKNKFLELERTNKAKLISDLTFHRFGSFPILKNKKTEQNDKIYRCNSCLRRKDWIKDEIIHKYDDDYKSHYLYKLFYKDLSDQDKSIVSNHIPNIMSKIYGKKVSLENYSILYEYVSFSAEIVEKKIYVDDRDCLENRERVMIYTIFNDDKYEIAKFRIKMTHEPLNKKDKIVLMFNDKNLFDLFEAQGYLSNFTNYLLSYLVLNEECENNFKADVANRAE